MVYADLHVHTDNSDGECSFSGILSAARTLGISVLGITDHDRLHPVLDAPVTEHDDITVVHGIELRVQAPEQRVDLLAYGVKPTDALCETIARIQRSRIERGRRIKTCLEDRLGVRLDVDLVEGVGRPHLARAVVSHPETEYDSIDAVFAELIGTDDPCFVAREVPDFETGVTVLSASSSFVGLAHPLRYPNPVAALELCSSLDAVERYYPYSPGEAPEADVDEATIDGIAEEYDLLLTGGSDAHDEHLGRAGLTRTEYAPIEAALPGS